MRLRYTLKLLQAFIKRFKFIFLGGVVAGLVFFVGFRYVAPLLGFTNTERIGVSGRYPPEDLPQFILKDISSGLTKITEDGIPVPDLAQKWETPDGGKTWIFTLDTSRTWQDGTKITSANIKYTFEDAQIQRPTADTIIFELKSPFTPFPSIVSRPAFKTGLLGTGEWKVNNLSLAGSFVQTLSLTNKITKQNKIYKFYPNEEGLKLAYKLGEVDVILDVNDIKPFDTWQTADIEESVNNNRFATILFNNSDNFLSDKKFRQALYYAINKDALGQSSNRALGPLSPTSWAYNPQVKTYDFDINHAKNLIRESGLPDDFKKNMNINLTTVPSLLPVAEKIAADWKNVGVETHLQTTQELPSEYQAFLIIYDVPSDPDQYSLWHSTQKETNITSYKNPRIDKLLEDGRLELDLEKRKSIYLDFQRFLLEDVPAAFLYHPVSYTVGRK